MRTNAAALEAKGDTFSDWMESTAFVLAAQVATMVAWTKINRKAYPPIAWALV